MHNAGMKKRATTRDWLPLSRAEPQAAEIPTGEAFRPAWIDFEKGIRVGNLEPHERITRIIKYRLEESWTTPFVTDRWGRGVYWQWICWVPRENREAKPISSAINFGCAKLYISLEKTSAGDGGAEDGPGYAGTGRAFRFGMTVERGIVKGKPSFPGILLKKDWDWHRFMERCVKGSALDLELQRLVLREGFTARIGGPADASFTAKNFLSAAQLRNAAQKAPPGSWAGFDLFYPMPEAEVRSATGWEIVQAILGAFTELAPMMNMCMQVPLRRRESETPSKTAKAPPRLR
jgi:hypothetical protein